MKTRHPVTEGLVALLEPFVDTVVVRTMTALTIVIASTPSWEQARAAVSIGADAPEGVTLTSDAFATVLPWFPVVLSVVVTLFAFSTVLSWAYYGQQAWQHLFGRGRVAGLVYKFVVCGFVLLAPVVKRELADFTAKVAAGHLRRGGRPEAELRDRRGRGEPTPAGLLSTREAM